MNPLRWVLDTNVVIDWLMFNDPYMNPLRERVIDGRVLVLTHQPAQDEFKRVLAYKQLKLTPERQQEIFARYCQYTSVVSLPSGASLQNLMMPAGFPRCRDRDDEHFIALAFHQKADALISRDNAVFGLKSRAEKFGLTILNVQQAIGLLGSEEIAES
ncbi:MAG: putative toxin-antitoxin system toxin component, PIN family [Pseudomonadota bacterium]